MFKITLIQSEGKMAESLDYKATSGKPIIVEVEKDGVEYLIKVGVAIVGITDTGNKDAENRPVFGIEAALTTTVSKK